VRPLHPPPCPPPAAQLPFLEPLLSGVFTADNIDYVPRDSYMCGVVVGPIDIQRVIYARDLVRGAALAAG
jgi:HD superfamily phosphohydrolase